MEGILDWIIFKGLKSLPWLFMKGGIFFSCEDWFILKSTKGGKDLLKNISPRVLEC